MADLAVTFEPLSEVAMFKAAEAWRCYRAQGRLSHPDRERFPDRRTRAERGRSVAHGRPRLLPEVFRWS